MLSAGCWVLAVSLLAADAPKVQLTLRDGLVSISATQATLTEILDAWERVGHTTIVNREKIARTPLTINLTDVPETQALALLLRSVSGYIALPRAAAQPDQSRFAQIVIMATPTAAAPTAAAPAAVAVQPPPPAVFARPSQPMPAPAVTRLYDANGQPVPDDQDGAPAGASAAPSGFSRGDSPPVAPQQQGPPPIIPSATPAAPPTTSTPAPGMIVPTPAVQPPPPSSSQR
jgi:hypothetical protein